MVFIVLISCYRAGTNVAAWIEADIETGHLVYKNIKFHIFSTQTSIV